MRAGNTLLNPKEFQKRPVQSASLRRLFFNGCSNLEGAGPSVVSLSLEFLGPVGQSH